jgi:thiol-disulfide isomerase/thioredoxin
MRLIFLCLSFCLFQTAFSKPIPKNGTSQDSLPPILNFSELEPLLTTQSDSVFIINFWATWCAPCVAELPYFEKLNAALKNKKAKVVLVSLDFKAQLQSKLLPFLNRKKLSASVLVLMDKDANNWIPKISPDWSGAIPATLIFDKTRRQFYEMNFETFADLKSVVKPFINF